MKFSSFLLRTHPPPHPKPKFLLAYISTSHPELAARDPPAERGDIEKRWYYINCPTVGNIDYNAVCLPSPRYYTCGARAS